MTATVRDHHDDKHEVDIPDGWHCVPWWQLPAKIGDRFLDVNELGKGRVAWRELLTQADLDAAPMVWDHLKCGWVTADYACLIRKNPGPEVYQGAGI